MSRICFLAGATHLGGGEKSLLELVSGLKERREFGYEPWVLLPKSTGPLIGELKRAGIDFDVEVMPEGVLKMSRAAGIENLNSAMRSSPEFLLYLRNIARILRRKKAVLIHTNAVKCHLLATALWPVVRRPILWHIRDIFANGPTLSILRGFARFPQIHWVANSKATATSFNPAFTSGQVIWNGLDPLTYHPARSRGFARNLGVSGDAPVVGIVGVLARWKGHPEFIELARRLVARGSSAHFVIVGDAIYDTVGETHYREELEKQVKEAGLTGRLSFTGFRSDVAEVMNGIDLLVHASIRPEPFGRVIVEAMACETPVVAVAAGGIPEIAESGKSALLYRAGDVDAKAEAVERMLGDADLRKRIAEEGRRVFLEKFTRDVYIQKVAGTYGKLL